MNTVRKGNMAQIGVRKGNIRKISVSISEESADWVETQVESQKYRNVSHAIDSVIRDAKKASEANDTVSPTSSR